MLSATLITGALALLLLFIGYTRGEGQHFQGVKKGFQMTLQVLPLLFSAFIFISMLQILIPKEAIIKWAGSDSGLRGIFLGSIAGGISPGGPLVHSVIAAGLFKSGAGVGTIVAFLTGGVLWGFTLIPMEVGILGWRLTLVRIASTCFFPPIAGIIAQTLFRNMVK